MNQKNLERRGFFGINSYVKLKFNVTIQQVIYWCTYAH